MDSEVIQKKRGGVFLLANLYLMLIFISGCQEQRDYRFMSKFPYVKSAPFSGKVVDEVTGEPIEGVIVIGHWPGALNIFQPENKIKTIEVLETVTDKEGNYSMPGWTKRNLYTSFTSSDPDIYLFKIGYEMKSFNNRWTNAGDEWI